MKIIKFLKEIPLLPLSALIFYLIMVFLWKLSIIPSPSDIVLILEKINNNYGMMGIFISAFLEGIVYLGLYFPGSFIIALAVLISDGSIKSLLTISLVVAIAISLTSIINYYLGSYVSSYNKHKYETINKNNISKGFLLSMVHPNSLAFYFFHAGIEKQHYWKIIYVPIIMMPYGFLFALILSAFREFLKSKLESPYTMLFLILIWIFLAFLFGHLSKKKRIALEKVSDEELIAKE